MSNKQSRFEFQIKNTFNNKFTFKTNYIPKNI